MMTMQRDTALRPIKVLIVDDSPVVVLVLQRILSSDPDIEVVATAENGEEALRLIKRLEPDVVCTDYHMPKMNGYQLTRKIMAESPRPILVVSVSVQEHQQENIFQLLEAGAVDILPKPRSGFQLDSKEANDLRARVKLLAGVKVVRRRLAPLLSDNNLNTTPVNEGQEPEIVAIGASTGGPNAILEILSALPGNFPLPIVCVQHISTGFLLPMIRWLDQDTRLRVKVAEENEQPHPGYVYFPQEHTHLIMNSMGRLDLSKEDPVSGHRPSVDRLFQSIAKRYDSHSICVLLTGMGADGASGMAAVARAGGRTIAQDEESSVVFGMPKEAIALGAVKDVLPLDQIGILLNTLVESVKR
ncbi:MAG: chemotaxis-specific protein-glutamate methyltransferase CheB [Thermodesulfobacteriota bacterium]